MSEQGTDSTSLPQPHALPSIPQLLTSTIGRSSEISRIFQLLTGPDVRLLVLTGPGGIGKTRLAIESAHRLRDQYPDGTHFIPLAPVRDPSGLIPAIASAFGVREAGGRSVAELLSARLQALETLIVLDNFEQIVSAAPNLVDLLQQCPGLRLLVTSRVVLHVTGEFTFPVPPLPVDSEDDPGGLPEAVHLFVDRARKVLPDFRLNDDSRPMVAAICRKLDGIPLAIELAAARLRHLPLNALEDRLDTQLNVLSQGPRDQPARLQTMRNAIAWSYELLDDAQQRLFRSVSVFAGGFDLSAAMAVSGIEEDLLLLDSLGDLVDASLLLQRTGLDERPRYRMLEVVREFGFEQLVRVGADQETLRLMADWAVDLTDEGWVVMANRRNQGGWLLRYDAEMANFSVAMDWLEAELDSEALCRLAGGLFWYWYVRGQYTRGSERLERALALPVRFDYDRSIRARAFYGLGILSHFQGNDARAIPMVEEALARWEAIDDEYGQGISRLMLGIIAEDEGDYDTALELVQKALQHARNAGDQANIALASYHLGVIQWGRGELEEATRLCDEALQMQVALGDRWGAANSLEYLGLFATMRGDVERANTLLRNSLEARLEIGTPYQSEEMAKYLADMAVLAVRCHTPEFAAELFGAEQRIRTDIGAFPGYPERTAYESASARACELLGDSGFQAAWDRGYAEVLDRIFDRARSFEPEARAAQVSSVETTLTGTGERLTPRELEVLELVALGLTNAAIADKLFVTSGTVRIHVSNILRKLDAANRTEAVSVARSVGTLPPS